MRLGRGLLLTFLAVLPTAAAAETVTLRADLWCPYNCNPGAAQPGYMIEVAKQALGQAGITVDYAIMPWERTVAEVEAGSVDGAVGASPDDVKGGVVPAQPLGISRNVLVLQQSTQFDYTGPASLATIRIGVAKGYSYDNGGDIDGYIKQATDAHSPMVEALGGDDVQLLNMRKMLAGHIGAVLDDQNVLQLVIAEVKPSVPVRVIPVSKATPEYIVFSPKNPQSARYAKLLDDGVVALRKSGALAAILARYNLKDWQ